MDYKPEPINTEGVTLPAELIELTELLSENAHDHWALQRMSEGWTYGPERDDTAKTHPDLVPYSELADSEKEYDRKSAMETLKAILSLGFNIGK